MRAKPTLAASLVLLLAAAPLAAQERAVFDASTVLSNVDTVTHLWDYDEDGRTDALGLRTLAWDDEVRHYLRVYHGVAGDEPFQTVGFVTRTDTEVTCVDELPAFAATDVGAFGGLWDYVLVYGTHVELFTVPATMVAQHTLPELGRGVTAGDFDGNGLGDFAVLLSDEVHVYLSPATPEVEVVELAFERTGWKHVHAAELTGDGVDDVLVVGPSHLSFRALPSGSGPGGPWTHTDAVPLAFRHAVAAADPAVGDVDGDGDHDVVIFGMAGEYRVLRQTAPGVLRLESPRAGGPATDLADVNGDGLVDGICCGGGGGNCPPQQETLSDFQVSLNTGGGAFAPSFAIPGLGARHVAGAADIDLDGDIDLVAGRVVYYSTGTYAASAPLVAGQIHPRSVGDVDGDGDPDFMIGVEAYRRNMGDGTSTPTAPVVPGLPPGQYWAGPGYPGDYDGDGNLDFVAEVWDGFDYVGMNVLRNAGGGSFEVYGSTFTSTPPLSEQTTLSPTSSLVADLDGDGTEDLVVLSRINAPSHFSEIWFNQGGGLLTEGPHWTDERVLLAAELTGDTDVDLVTYEGGGLRLREGLGGGTFGAPQFVSTGYQFQSGGFDVDKDRFAVGDFVIDDGVELPDGQLDLVAAHRFNGFDPVHYVHLLRGGSAPLQLATYTGIEAFKAYEEPVRVQDADLDGDGWKDLLVSPAPAAVLATEVHLRDAVGRFDRTVVQVVQPLVLADVDGDGDQDALDGTRVALSRLVTGGSRLQMGAGEAGTGGVVPTLGAVGPFRTGERIEIRITGGCGGAPVELYHLTSDPHGPQDLAGRRRILASRLSGTPEAPGAGSLTVRLRVPRRLAGETVDLEAWIADREAGQGASRTNVLRIRVAD